MTDIPSGYYNLLARIESANNPLARATSSTASGLYQFTRSTWEGLGGTWGGQSGKAFGGASPSVSQQREYAERLTRQNETALKGVGVGINNATLYAAHFLGADGAKRILKASADTPIEDVTSAAQRRANPTILKGSVGDFFDWLKKKTGDAVTGATMGMNTTPDFTPPFTDANSSFGNLPALPELPSFEEMAKLALEGNILSGIGDAVKNTIEGAGEAIKEANPMTGVLDFFKNLFSQNTAIRFLVVVIGLVALAAAVYSLVKPNLGAIAGQVLKEAI